MSDKWIVKVVDSETGEVVKTLEAANERAADRLDDGLNINLNHSKYHTAIEAPKGQP